MATVRRFVLGFALLCAGSPLAPGARQVQRSTEVVKREEATDEPNTTRKPAISAEEAVRLAIETLDRLEERAESDARRTLLAEVNGYIETVRDSQPGNPWLGYLQGRALVFAGRRGDAIERLREFVGTPEGRSEWRAYRILGDLFAVQFPQLARANYEKARALNPNEPSVLLGLSMCAAKLGAAKEAVDLARKAVAADAEHTVRYVSHLARALKAADRSDEALEEAQRALDLAKQDLARSPGTRLPLLVVDAQYQLLIEIMQARLSEPLPQATGSRSAAKHDLSGDYLRLAACLRDRAKITQMLARHELLRVLEAGVNRTAPDTPPALLEQYGAALGEVGRTKSAIEVFENLLAADPKNAAATAWLDRLQERPTGTARPEQP